jgi:hypothetical protein
MHIPQVYLTGRSQSAAVTALASMESVNLYGLQHPLKRYNVPQI